MEAGNIKVVLLLLTGRHSTHKITESKLFFPELLNSPSQHTQVSALEYTLTATGGGCGGEGRGERNQLLS